MSARPTPIITESRSALLGSESPLTAAPERRSRLAIVLAVASATAALAIAILGVIALAP